MTKRLYVVGLVLVAVVLALSVGPTVASAAFDLQVTEIWPGNDPGSNLTEDWFKVTNVGDAAWSAVLDGDLYFDDNSESAADADLMEGVASIASGESVVFVDGGASGAAEWSTVWGDVVVLPQVGYYDGAGLGQGGDGVALFIDVAGVLTEIDYEAYPDASSDGGQSWDVALQSFSTVGNASGAVATLALNDENQPAIGSPGPALVPEPGSIVLLLLGVAGLAACRR